jgi:hypothetical protein
MPPPTINSELGCHIGSVRQRSCDGDLDDMYDSYALRPIRPWKHKCGQSLSSLDLRGSNHVTAKVGIDIQLYGGLRLHYREVFIYR